MKILHTADLHLQEFGDERWKTLEQLLQIGTKEKIDAFLICGDLFDRNVKAEILRPKIQELFSNKDFKILIIPGNHDAESFRQDLYFGENTEILTREPFEYGKVRFLGIPFEQIEGEKFLAMIRSLKRIMTDDMTNIILFHGELLDTFFSRRDFGEEGEGRYMPAKLSYFKGLSADYVLAGHFHTNFDVRTIDKDQYFVYCGSPVSVTRREKGQRKINLFKVGEAPKPFLLDTPHFEEKVIRLDPFSGDDPFDLIKKNIAGIHPKATVDLKITGYINGAQIHRTEQQFIEELRKLVKGKKGIELHTEFSDVQRILEKDIFNDFMKKLELSDFDNEEFEEIRDMTMRAIMEAGV